MRIVKNATPGSVKEKTLQSPDKNGGALGADNPTYHATDRLGLDSDHPRARHRHLERRLPDRAAGR